MKKTIAILLILVIGMVGVFAADDPYAPEVTTSKTLELTTTVVETTVFAVTGTDYSTNSFYAVFGPTGAVLNDTVTTRAVDIDSGLAADTYLTIGTNLSAGFSVYLLSAEKLSLTELGSKIDYTILVGEATWDTASPPSPLTGQKITTVSSSGAAKVISNAITVEIDPESYYNAEATSGNDVYTADVIFNISAT